MVHDSAGKSQGFYERIVSRLKEREKELVCLYAVEELLRDDKPPIEDTIRKLLTIIPTGWQHRTICEVRIIFEGKVFRSDDFIETKWIERSDIILDRNVAGRIDVVYTQLIDPAIDDPFMPEEQKLLDSIAERLGNHIFSRRLRATVTKLQASPEPLKPVARPAENMLSPDADIHWKWRYRMAEILASKLDLDRFGVKGIYLIGSTKNATAGPASDIDLIIHFDGSEEQKKCLNTWLEGWSLCLAEMSLMRSGYKPKDGLIDCHFVTDEDIAKKNSFACMIGSIENSARPLKVRTTPANPAS